MWPDIVSWYVWCTMWISQVRKNLYSLSITRWTIKVVLDTLCHGMCDVPCGFDRLKWAKSEVYVTMELLILNSVSNCLSLMVQCVNQYSTLSWIVYVCIVELFSNCLNLKLYLLYYLRVGKIFVRICVKLSLNANGPNAFHVLTCYLWWYGYEPICLNVYLHVKTVIFDLWYMYCNVISCFPKRENGEYCCVVAAQ